MTSTLGRPLTDSDYRKLEEESWITREIADAAGIIRVNSQEGAEIVGRSNNKDYSGTVFPYREPGTEITRSYRLRRDHPDYEIRADGTRKEIEKYLTAPGERNRLYYPPGLDPAMLADTSIPVVVAEGEKKTLALWRLANYETGTPRFMPVGISGVWNWRGTITREPGPDGLLHPVTGPLPDLDAITWKGRRVVILFDSDAARKKEVRAARRKLADELEGRV
jgi:hypothetical protein